MTLHHTFEDMGPEAVKSALAARVLTFRAEREAREWLTIRQAIDNAMKRTALAGTPAAPKKLPIFIQPLATLFAACIGLSKH
ncbi:MAG: hypothetical protein U1E18_08780 [Brevundimonas sp.]|uniref:hypothetical protein n=1 Tax=Brevundimonas sp. TaxID=1871086 RepID=UPI002AB96AC2|nr:hypothetical protein [Brevundimonas sp.]MDZ4109677.1 hypothetical protein [Brevundimonas sp.]